MIINFEIFICFMQFSFHLIVLFLNHSLDISFSVYQILLFSKDIEDVEHHIIPFSR